ncbi:transporter, partial [Pseudomonas sp. FW305-42]
MDTLPYAPLLGIIALALLWSALFTAVDCARQQLNGHGAPPLPAHGLV